MIWGVRKVINVVNHHTLDEIKRGLEKYLGRDVVVRAHRGRKKFEKKEGVLECTYPNVFVVSYEGNDNHVTRVSYSYADILTSTVQLTLMRNENSKKQTYS